MKRWLVTRRDGRSTLHWTGEFTVHGFPDVTPYAEHARQFTSATDAYEAASRVTLMADSDLWRVTAWEPV